MQSVGSGPRYHTFPALLGLSLSGAGRFAQVERRDSLEAVASIGLGIPVGHDWLIAQKSLFRFSNSPTLSPLGVER
jgi:hypothetical protein